MGTLTLKVQARQLGFTQCGVADPDPALSWEFYRDWLDAGHGAQMDYLRQHLELKQSPAALLPDVRSVVAVTLNYNQPNPPQAGAPKIARYARGRDYHKVLRGKLRSLAAWIEREHPGSQCRVCVDSAPILEREYAHRAGLGWFGKNTMLIDSRTGSWFFIGILLTTAEFEPDAPSLGGCGACTRCIDACPTGAIIQENGRWQVDARRCVSYLTIEHRGVFSAEQSAMVGDWTFGCDVCQEICPFNQPRPTQPRRAPVTTEADFLGRDPWPPLTEVAEMGEERWDELTRGSAIRRTTLDGIRRNARANLRNQARR